ncbi:hypothetical protein [Nocardiopsis nanhaiensis]
MNEREGDVSTLQARKGMQPPSPPVKDIEQLRKKASDYPFHGIASLLNE